MKKSTIWSLRGTHERFSQYYIDLVVLWEKQSGCASVPLSYYPNSPIIWEFVFGEQP